MTPLGVGLLLFVLLIATAFAALWFIKAREASALRKSVDTAMMLASKASIAQKQLEQYGPIENAKRELFELRKAVDRRMGVRMQILEDRMPPQHPVIALRHIGPEQRRREFAVLMRRDDETDIVQQADDDVLLGQAIAQRHRGRLQAVLEIVDGVAERGVMSAVGEHAQGLPRLFFPVVLSALGVEHRPVPGAHLFERGALDALPAGMQQGGGLMGVGGRAHDIGRALLSQDWVACCQASSAFASAG